MKKFFYKKRKLGEKGFTIIEMIIAIGIFLIVVTIGVSALVNLYVVNRKAQNMRSILDGLSFAMEDMSRNIRTGYNYSCLVKGNTYNNQSQILISTTRDCLSNTTGGFGIAFEYSGGELLNSGDQWVYYIQEDSNGIGKLYRSTDSLATSVQMTPDEVDLDSNTWNFSVYGSSNADIQQPIVILRLVGEIRGRAGEMTPFSLQTTVSQRLFDMPPND